MWFTRVGTLNWVHPGGDAEVNSGFEVGVSQTVQTQYYNRTET